MARDPLALVVVAASCRRGTAGGETRRTALDQLESSGFAEYFEPFTGEPLGAYDQSWTAAVALDMLAAGTSATS